MHYDRVGNKITYKAIHLFLDFRYKIFSGQLLWIQKKNRIKGKIIIREK